MYTIAQPLLEAAFLRAGQLNDAKERRSREEARRRRKAQQKERAGEKAEGPGLIDPLIIEGIRAAHGKFCFHIFFFSKPNAYYS